MPAETGGTIEPGVGQEPNTQGAGETEEWSDPNGSHVKSCSRQNSQTQAGREVAETSCMQAGRQCRKPREQKGSAEQERTNKKNKKKQ